MILDGRCIDILVGVGVSLGWQSVHLLVDLGSVQIELGELLLGGALELALLEGEGITSESLLQLGGLRVEAVIVLPLVLKVQLLLDTEGESASEGKELQYADLAIEGNALHIVNKPNLPQLEREGQ